MKGVGAKLKGVGAKFKGVRRSRKASRRVGIETNRGAGGEKRARAGPKSPQGSACAARTRSHGDRREDAERDERREVKSLRIGVHHANAVVWGPVIPKRALASSRGYSSITLAPSHRYTLSASLSLIHI